MFRLLGNQGILMRPSSWISSRRIIVKARATPLVDVGENFPKCSQGLEQSHLLEARVKRMEAKMAAAMLGS